MEKEKILKACIIFIILQAVLINVYNVLNRGLRIDTFVIFIFILTTLYFFGFWYTKNYEVPIMILILGSLLSLLYLAGNQLHIGSSRLYDTYILILRYDYFVHALAPFIMTFVLYAPLKKHMKLQKKDKRLFYGILMLSALGIAVAFEINELFQVVFFNKGPQVGDYMNNAFDLFFGVVGVILAGMILMKR